MVFVVKNFKIIRNVFIVCCVVFSIYTLCTNKGANINSAPLENIKLRHYNDERYELLEFGKLYTPQPNSIFFHETSSRKNLTSRQACAVESAARAHPDWDIHLLFSSPLSKLALEQGSIKELHSMKNVKLLRINITDYAAGTPLEKLILEGDLNKSKWIVEHTSDVLRYLTLYKWGGVYMDLDVVVAKSLASLARNWAARESDLWIGSAIFAFSRDAVGKIIADTAVRDLKSNFRGDIWNNNGPGVITRVLKNICSTNNLLNMSSGNCKGFEVYGPPFFYPVHFSHGKDYFTPGNIDVQNVYVHHIWNYLTKNYTVHKDSPYAKLAVAYCPSIFKLYGDEFGN